MSATETQAEKKRLSVKKHVAMIHCTNSLSLLQRKLSNALLFHAYHHLEEREIHEISTDQLCKLIGYRGKNYAVIKEAFRTLLTTVIEWNLTGDKVDGDWAASAALASVRISGGTCYYAYSPHIKQLLHSPQMYGSLNLLIQSKFRSSYGLALYENCMRYKSLGKTKWFDIQLFRKLMGVPEGQYEIYRDFKRRVIEKAIQEVNSHSDLELELDIEKANRKVVAVRFLIKTKAGAIPTNQPALQKPSENSLVETLRLEFSLSNNKIQSLLKSYDEAYLLSKITYVMSTSAFKEGKVKSKAAYLQKAIQDDYQPQPSENEQVRKSILEREQHQKESRQREDLYDQYLKSTNTEIRTIFDALPLEIQESLREEFLGTIKGSFYEHVFLDKGLVDILVFDKFCDYLRVNHPSIVNGIISFDDYVNMAANKRKVL